MVHDINFYFLFITECLILYLFFLFAGTGQGLKLTLNVESEEYMAGPLSGLGVLVSLSKHEYAGCIISIFHLMYEKYRL